MRAHGATAESEVGYSGRATWRPRSRQAFAVAQAKAQQQLDDSLSKAARDRTYANADAESTLTQSIARVVKKLKRGEKANGIMSWRGSLWQICVGARVAAGAIWVDFPRRARTSSAVAG